MKTGSFLAISVALVGAAAFAMNCGGSTATSPFAAAGSGAAGGDDSSTSTGCLPGSVRCACASGSLCLGTLTCLSGICVDTAATTATGMGGASVTSTGTVNPLTSVGPGGASTVSSTQASTGSVNPVTSSSVSSTTVASSTVASSTVASTGSGQTNDCGNAPLTVIDNFYTCDLNICDIAGRSGKWYAFDAVEQMFFIGDPPPPWLDGTCAVRTTGGDVPLAGIGLVLANSLPYDLSGWSGIGVKYEDDHPLLVELKIPNPGGDTYFGATIPATPTAPAGLPATYVVVDFSSMVYKSGPVTTLNQQQLSMVTEIQFLPTNATLGFGFAIHEVTLN